MNACWCSECGEGAHFDEDGLCVSCGTSMISPDVFEAICKTERSRCMHAAEAIVKKFVEQDRERFRAELAESARRASSSWSRDE